MVPTMIAMMLAHPVGGLSPRYRHLPTTHHRCPHRFCQAAWVVHVDGDRPGLWEDRARRAVDSVPTDDQLASVVDMGTLTVAIEDHDQLGCDPVSNDRMRFHGGEFGRLAGLDHDLAIAE